MPRRKNVKISLDDEGLENFLNEANNIINDTIGRSKSQFNDLKKVAKDEQQEAMMSKPQNDLLKILNDCARGKLDIAKIIKDKIRDDKAVITNTDEPDKIDELNKLLDGNDFVD